MRLQRIAILTFCLLFVNEAALGQESRASIAGTVTDPSGSVVAAAKLRLTNVETGVAFDAASNEVGQYRYLFLNPGRYRLVAEMSGFRTFIREQIQLQVSQTATVDVVLQVGSQTESVTVGAEAPLLEAEKADRGLVINNRNVVELPLNIRNPIMLAALTPGIQATTVSLDQNPFSNNGISSWSVNGSSNKTTDFLLDGAPNNAVYNQENTIAYVPPIEAVQEFKVMTSTYDAQYGRSGGGTVNVSLKSGTNGFHGSAYEFLKRTGLNANTFADNAKGNPRQGNALNQYGFTLGGPVVIPKIYNGKDKTFFFFAYEGYGEDIFRANESVGSVPTLDQRRGDFSKTFDNRGALMPIYDPLTHAPGRRPATSGTCSPTTSSRPTASTRSERSDRRLSGAQHEHARLYRLAEQLLLRKSNVGRFDFQNYTARIDHHFSPRAAQSTAGGCYNDFVQGRITNGIPGLGANARTGGKRNDGIVIDSVTMISPSTILNVAGIADTLGGGYLPAGGAPQLQRHPDRLAAVARQPITRGRTASRSLQSPAILRSATTRSPSSPPTCSASSPTSLLDARPPHHQGRSGLSHDAVDAVPARLLRRPHELRPRLHPPRTTHVRTRSAATAPPRCCSATPFPAKIDNQTRPYYEWIYYAPWMQDDIKITRRLTLNLGLRWDYIDPVTEMHDRVNRGFFKDQVNPISDQIDQTKFPGYKVYGGIGFAGRERPVPLPVQSRPEQLPAADRRGVSAYPEDGAARRLGHLLHQSGVQRQRTRLQPEHAVRIHARFRAHAGQQPVESVP